MNTELATLPQCPCNVFGDGGKWWGVVVFGSELEPFMKSVGRWMNPVMIIPCFKNVSFPALGHPLSLGSLDTCHVTLYVITR